MPRALWLIVLSVLGCQQATPIVDPPPLDRCFSAPPQNPTSLVGIEHRELAFVLRQPVTNCGADPARTSQSVVVLTPGNLPFDAVTLVTEPYTTKTGSSSVSVRFTPNAAGTWQIIATFEPAFGRVQVPVEIAADLSNSPRRHVVDLPFDPSTCVPQPYRTKSGLVLCAGNETIRSLRDGGEGSFAGTYVEVFGDSVWLSQYGLLNHCTDTGSGTDLRYDAKVFEGDMSAMFFSANTALDSISTDTLARYDYDGVPDAGFTTTTYSIPFTESAFISDGGLWWTTGSNPGNRELCTEGPPVQCRPFNDFIEAIDDDGLWHFNGEGFTPAPLTQGHVLARLPFGWKAIAGDRGLRAREAMAVRGFSDLLGPLDSTPFVIVFENRELVWRYYGPKLLGTRGDFIVMQTGPKQVTFFER